MHSRPSGNHTEVAFRAFGTRRELWPPTGGRRSAYGEGFDRGEDLGRFWPNAEVSVRFGEGDHAGPVDDEDRRQRQTPAPLRRVLIAPAGVDEGDVDQDRLVVAAVRGRNGVG